MQILSADFKDPKAPEIFTRSLHETGFGVIKNHPIPVKLIEDVYSDWKKFFLSDSKHQYLFDKQTQSGYFPFKSENAKDSKFKDLKEFFHVFPHTKIPEETSQSTKALFTALMQLGSTLLNWIDEFTPAEIRKQFSMRLSMMSEGSPQNLFRIIHYPPLTGSEEEGAVRAAAHEDINLITLLPASTTMGLQVKDNEGLWHDVQSEWGQIVINVGDMLQMASQGYYKSTTHRVVNPAGDAAKLPRYSMPLFVHPRPDVRLSEKHTADSYLKERLREIGLI